MRRLHSSKKTKIYITCSFNFGFIPRPIRARISQIHAQESGNPCSAAPCSSHVCNIRGDVKTHPKSKTNIFWKQGSKKSDPFLDTSKTTKPRDIHIQVRRTPLHRVPRNSPMFDNKIQPPMERFHFFSHPNPKIWVAAFLTLPQEAWLVVWAAYPSRRNLDCLQAGHVLCLQCAGDVLADCRCLVC